MSFFTSKVVNLISVSHFRDELNFITSELEVVIGYWLLVICVTADLTSNFSAHDDYHKAIKKYEFIQKILRGC